MPRIPDEILNTAFFVYPPSEEAACVGKPIGGTGFIVTIQSSGSGYRYAYGVTNWHLAIDQGHSFIRINRRDGAEPEIFRFDSSDWTAHPDGCDIAAVPLPINPAVHDVSAVPSEFFARPEITPNMGLGDDVFMAGRFVDHDGGATNVPSVRFGNIAVLPTLMEQRPKQWRESYVIDLHSRTGYSGSPVFIYRAPGSDFAAAREKGGTFDLSAPSFLHLLGIHWAQFPEWQRVFEETTDKAEKKPPIGWAEGYSGMTCVIPAERILELLNISKFKKQREDGDVAIARIAEQAQR